MMCIRKYILLLISSVLLLCSPGKAMENMVSPLSLHASEEAISLHGSEEETTQQQSTSQKIQMQKVFPLQNLMHEFPQEKTLTPADTVLYAPPQPKHHVSFGVRIAPYPNNYDTSQTRALHLQQIYGPSYAQVLQDPALYQAYQARIFVVQSDLNKALDALNACKLEHNKPQDAIRLINFLDVSIREPKLNDLLLDAKDKIAPYITNADGSLCWAHEDNCEKIAQHVQEFRNAVDTWQKKEGALSLAHQAVHPPNLSTIKKFNDTPLAYKIKTNEANQDFLKARNLCERQKLDEVLHLFSHYHQQALEKRDPFLGHQAMLYGVYHQGVTLLNQQYERIINACPLKEYKSFTWKCITPDQRHLRAEVIPIAQEYVKKLQHADAQSAHDMKETLDWFADQYGKALKNDEKAQSALKDFIASYQKTLELPIIPSSQLGQDIKLTTVSQDSCIINEEALQKLIESPLLDEEIRQALQPLKKEHEIHPCTSVETQLSEALEYLQSEIGSLQDRIDAEFDEVINEVNADQKYIQERKDIPKIIRALPIVSKQVVKRLAEIGKSINHPLESAYGLAQGCKQLGTSLYHLGLVAAMLDSIEENIIEPRFSRSDIKAVLKEEIEMVKTATTHMGKMSKADLLKLGTNILVDQVAFAKALKVCSSAKEALKNSARELGIIKKLPSVKKISQGLETVEQLENFVSQEIKALEELEKIPQSLGSKVDQVSKLKNVLVQRAQQLEESFLKAHEHLPRAQWIRQAFTHRVARLTAQYGKETVEEALTLFRTSEEALIEQVKLLDRLEYVTQSLNKINSNARWKAFKFDPAQGKISLGSIDEAIAGIACEEQNLLGTLTRSSHVSEEFLEGVMKKPWDVKSAPAYSLEGIYIFDSDIFLKSVKNALLKNPYENIIINASYLSKIELQKLFDSIKKFLTNNELQRVILVHAFDPLQSKQYLNIFRSL